MPTSPQTATRLARQDDAATEFAALHEQFAANLAARVARMLDGDPGGSTSAENRIAQARNGDQLRAAVLQLELEEIEELAREEIEVLADAWFERYPPIAAAAEAELGRAGVSDPSTLFDDPDAAERFEAMAERHESALIGTMQRAAAVRALDALHGGIETLSHAELADQIQQAELRTANSALSEAITRIAEADRRTMDLAVQAAEGRGGGEFLFAYDGPNDAKTRPFCGRLVGKAFTRRQFAALRNGQIGNVLHNGGGYRCRHLAVPVRAEQLADLGYTRGTDADVAAANAAAAITRRRRR